MSDFPIFSYGIPGGFLLLNLIAWAVEQHCSRYPWWRELPWGKIIFCTAIFMAGQIYADAVNPNSQLRHWYSNLGVPFTIVTVATDHKMGEKERVEVWALVQFDKDMRNPNLVMRVTNLGPGDKKRTAVVMNKRLGDVARQSREKIPVARIVIPRPHWKPHPPYWGDGTTSSMSPNGRNIVEISINGRSRDFYVEFLDASREDTQRVFIVTDKDNHLAVTY